jgi:hypothetical protein
MLANNVVITSVNAQSGSGIPGSAAIVGSRTTSMDGEKTADKKSDSGEVKADIKSDTQAAKNDSIAKKTYCN